MFVSSEVALMTILILNRNAINVLDLVADKLFVDAKKIIAMDLCH